MHTLNHYFQINSPIDKVFEAFSTPGGLNTWWTQECEGTPKLNEVYRMYFGPDYDWKAKVTVCDPPMKFEIRMIEADEEWTNNIVGADFSEKDNVTAVRFYNSGWENDSEHFRISTYCWAMYLRLLKRYVEFGEVVEYEKRLEV